MRYPSGKVSGWKAIEQSKEEGQTHEIRPTTSTIATIKLMINRKRKGGQPIKYLPV